MSGALWTLPPLPVGTPWASPPPRNSQYLGLKSALQGPEGAWVWEQGGQSRDGGREGREKLQERKGGSLQALAEHSGPGGTRPRPPALGH